MRLMVKPLLVLLVWWATAVSPAWAQTAFDDADAQLRVRQAATAASEAARKVEAARKGLEAERQRVVATDGERELNRATINVLEQELQRAETKQREQDTALRAAQDARVRGLAAEAERRRIEDGQRPQAPARPAPTPPPSRSPAVTTEAQELAAWNTIVASTNPAMFEIFIREFPNSVFAAFARARLDELKAQGASDAARRAEAEARRAVDIVAEVEKVLIDREMQALDKAYPTWREIVGAVDMQAGEKPPEGNPFRQWLAAQSAEYQKEINGTNSPAVVQGAIERFLGQEKTVKAPGTPSSR